MIHMRRSDIRDDFMTSVFNSVLHVAQFLVYTFWFTGGSHGVCGHIICYCSWTRHILAWSSILDRGLVADEKVYFLSLYIICYILGVLPCFFFSLALSLCSFVLCRLLHPGQLRDHHVRCDCSYDIQERAQLAQRHCAGVRDYPHRAMWKQG